MSFEGQRAVVIGASTGIGEATARSFAAAGAEVIITGRSKSRLDAAAERIGYPVESREVDATDAEAVAGDEPDPPRRTQLVQAGLAELRRVAGQVRGGHLVEEILDVAG